MPVAGPQSTAKPCNKGIIWYSHCVLGCLPHLELESSASSQKCPINPPTSFPGHVPFLGQSYVLRAMLIWQCPYLPWLPLSFVLALGLWVGTMAGNWPGRQWFRQNFVQILHQPALKQTLFPSHSIFGELLLRRSLCSIRSP